MHKYLIRDFVYDAKVSSNMDFTYGPNLYSMANNMYLFKV